MARSKNQKLVKAVPQPKKILKDPGVPKLIVMKAKAEIKQSKNSLQTRRSGPSNGDSMELQPSISTLAALAAQEEAAEQLEAQGQAEGASEARLLKRHYIRLLHKVVDQSDIILLVLDARDPEGCRSKLVEDEVRRREVDGKKLIFVLNKIDLVPRPNAEAWLRYLRHSAPTLAFKSSTQEQRSNIASRTSPALIKLIKSYKPPSGILTVGVVGYPNVGKSSLINSLKRARVCAVASEPGWTKDLQTVAIDRGLKVIDSPGVVFDDADSPSSLLRNVLKPEDIPDPISVIDQILARTEQETLQNLYKIHPFRDASEFLTMIALTAGRLGPGGVPDLQAAATQVMRDWNSSKIAFFSQVPEVHPSLRPSDAPGAQDVGETRIVSEWKPAFDLGDLFGQADADALEGEDAIIEDGHEMEQDNRLPVIPQKRPHSPDSDELQAAHAAELSATNLDPSLPITAQLPGPLVLSPSTVHPPLAKRSRHVPNEEMELDEANVMAGAHPMSRKAQRKEAKKGRKDQRRMDGMRVDDIGDESNSSFTFRAALNGAIAM